MAEPAASPEWAPTSPRFGSGKVARIWWEGFDCSGLIQFAFGKHGITLPRRSTDQARKGGKVDRKLDRLKPGDLLTFSNRGGPVTHVGLYVGGGRFIHSATKGVQISTLSAVDPYGRWWYKRWVGVRRLIPEG